MKTLHTSIARNGREITITRTRDDGSEKTVTEHMSESADAWRAVAEGAARDSIALVLTRENAARTGAREGRKVARAALGKIDATAILAGVLAGE